MSSEDCSGCFSPEVEGLQRQDPHRRAFAAQVDQRFPTLCAHLTRHGVNVSSMALNWFLTMFVTSLPLESTLRVWDVLFFDRCSSVLFRCALALVDIYAQVLPLIPLCSFDLSGDS
jgi:Rab-GTPase-TBC domain